MTRDLRVFRDRILLELCDALSLVADQAQYAGAFGNESYRVDVDAMARNHYNIAVAWDLNLEQDQDQGQDQDILCDLLTQKYEFVDANQRCLFKILIDGYKAYRKQSSIEYWSCMATEDFEDALAACLTRLPNLEALEIGAQRGALMDARAILETNDLDGLRRFVEFGHHGPWKGPNGSRDYYLARIMKRLPGKIHDAGIRLRTLRLGAVPFATRVPRDLNDEKSATQGHLPDDAALALAAVARTLEHVTFTAYHEPGRWWDNWVEDCARVVLSSPALRTLELLVPQATGGGVPESPRTPIAHRVGRLLAERTLVGLRGLRLTGVAVRAASLVPMLAGCSGEVHLDGVYLEDGLWADVLDEVVAAPRRGRAVRMRCVRGGEMGRILLHEPVAREKEDEYVRMGYGGTEPIVLLMAERYLACDARVPRNPFREHKNNGAYFRARKSLATTA
ncbi:hypothetical protein ISF_01341 [Cordyceps fumosorosea ARSEF 2679]|uniref:Uncharacterized protein n=1 Tax=Cordyceps fumosorosea (strain ARSEF 2679) TaxID=1081104 RepID=A0A168D7W0_CORFA|nr:hypothetical protein ISF_01341 [Cordyceps fumosorosea ARSEF 2679]OAA72268.1 hypothetical protein ISF_01341 [Cordyceps fumosorosea ARSEF 2679]